MKCFLSTLRISSHRILVCAGCPRTLSTDTVHGHCPRAPRALQRSAPCFLLLSRSSLCLWSVVVLSRCEILLEAARPWLLVPLSVGSPSFPLGFLFQNLPDVGTLTLFVLFLVSGLFFPIVPHSASLLVTLRHSSLSLNFDLEMLLLLFSFFLSFICEELWTDVDNFLPKTKTIGPHACPRRLFWTLPKCDEMGATDCPPAPVMSPFLLAAYFNIPTHWNLAQKWPVSPLCF